MRGDEAHKLIISDLFQKLFFAPSPQPVGVEKKESFQCDLFTRIAADFPGDVGCWSVYFMNYVTLQEGESMFLGPNVPHAYIFGGIGHARTLLIICTFMMCVCVSVRRG